MLSLLAKRYEELLKYCGSEDFDPDKFLVMHDAYASAFRDLSMKDQGEVAELIKYQHKWQPVFDKFDDLVGVAPMKAPSASVFELRKKYSSGNY